MPATPNSTGDDAAARRFEADAAARRDKAEAAVLAKLRRAELAGQPTVTLDASEATALLNAAQARAAAAAADPAPDAVSEATLVLERAGWVVTGGNSGLVELDPPPGDLEPTMDGADPRVGAAIWLLAEAGWSLDGADPGDGRAWLSHGGGGVELEVDLDEPGWPLSVYIGLDGPAD